MTQKEFSQTDPNHSDVERRIPKLMARPTTETSSSGSARRLPRLLCAKQKTQAALVNEVEGQCPVCKSPMKLSVANGIDVYVCMDHRVVMPLKNEIEV